MQPVSYLYLIKSNQKTLLILTQFADLIIIDKLLVTENDMALYLMQLVYIICTWTIMKIIIVGTYIMFIVTCLWFVLFCYFRSFIIIRYNVVPNWGGGGEWILCKQMYFHCPCWHTLFNSFYSTDTTAHLHFDISFFFFFSFKSLHLAQFWHTKGVRQFGEGTFVEFVWHPSTADF